MSNQHLDLYLKWINWVVRDDNQRASKLSDLNNGAILVNLAKRVCIYKNEITFNQDPEVKKKKERAKKKNL